MSTRLITYAEAFRQHCGHAYPAANVITTLLQERVIAESAYSVADANDTETGHC